MQYKKSLEYLYLKYNIYNGEIEIDFELSKKYVQHVNAGSTKWDKIELYQVVNILEKQAPWATR